MHIDMCDMCDMFPNMHIVKVKETQPKMEFQLTGLGESN